MEVERRLVAPRSAADVFPYVDDLGVYPTWMRLAHEVEAVESGPGEDLAWDVEIRAQVGPLARSKRLRMVRTLHDRPASVAFERAETDGRTHAPWTLRADLVPVDGDDASTELVMTLRYGGNLWTGAVLERVLDDQVRLGSERLLELLTDDLSSPPTR
ncbi:MAG: SRPBCC family protein [Ilumatobacteraceae bacterium]